MPSSASTSPEDDDDEMPSSAEPSPSPQAFSSESDDDQEDEENDEEEEEEEAGNENKEEDQSADSPSGGSPVPADDASDDTSQDMESDKNDEDPRATSISPEKSKVNLVSHGLDIGGCDCEFPVNHSNEVAEKQCKEVPYMDDRDFKPSILRISPVSSEENRLLGSTNEITNQIPMLKKRISIEASDNVVQNDVSEVHNGVRNDGAVVGADSTKCIKEDEKAVGTLCRDGFGDSEAGSIPCSLTETKHIHMQSDVQSAEDLKLNASSSHTPQQRPRSLTPDAELGNTSKRPAIVCDFFARGWCIKGNSCKFLHQKVGIDNSGQWTKGNLAGAGKLVGNDNAGLRPAAERSRLSTLVEPSNAENPSRLSERFLPQEYGQSKQHHLFHEGGRLSSFQREDLSFGIVQRIESGQPEIFHSNARVISGNPREALSPDSNNTSLIIREDFPKLDTCGIGHALHEKLSPRFNLVNDRRLVNQEIISRNYPEAVRMHHEIPKGEHLNDELFARGSPLLLPRHNSAPGCTPFPSGLSIPSSIYGDDHPSHPGTTPSSAERLSAPNILDSDKGLYMASRSASLPRGSSSYYSRPESEDPPFSAGFRTKLTHSYDWEPSVPFRSSFYCAPASISSPGSQYDPLVDSIEPPNGGSIAIQASTCSQEMLSQNITHQLPNGDTSSARNRNLEYNAEKCLHSFHESREGSLDHNVYKHGLIGSTTEAGPTGKNHITNEETIGSKAKVEKPLSDHAHIVGSANFWELDLDGSSKHQMEKSRHSKDSKAMKLFHSALVDFVKELVKPSWREGHLSKDAHKMIVKKAVDKVLSTLNSHQIPNTAESIKQYLSSSRPKLTKLVEGYVDKYSKS